MQDMQAKLGKLLTEAENCALIAKLAPNARTRGKSVVLLGPWNNFANGQNVRQFQIQFSHCEIQHGFTSTVGRKLRADLESGLDSFGAIGATCAAHKPSPHQRPS
jgi:hypothetical protein